MCQCGVGSLKFLFHGAAPEYKSRCGMPVCPSMSRVSESRLHAPGGRIRIRTQALVQATWGGVHDS